MDGEAWWATVHGIAKSRIRLSNFTLLSWRGRWWGKSINLGPGESWAKLSAIGTSQFCDFIWVFHAPCLGFFISALKTKVLSEPCTRAQSCLTLCDLTVAWWGTGCCLVRTDRLLCPWDSPGKNTGTGSHLFLQGIFLAQGSNPSLRHWQADSLLLSNQQSPSLSPARIRNWHLLFTT